ncbi:MAG: beta-lactamase family protein [Saprospiraceae bacterium]|nr:beta-lactamase family protein [Saprospiraceae bacterium]
MKDSCILLTACFLMAILSCNSSQENHSHPFASIIDEIMQDWESDEPGGAVAVIEKGQVIYEQYFGLADLERGIPFSAQTQTDIGSISKQFTACLIALLEEEGQLSLEDDIRKFIPELPAYRDTVRIKHLLHHTSGIRDYEALEMLKGRHYFDDHMTNPFVIDLMARQRALNFPPNTRYEYSNSNYILLAEIIESVSNRTLNEAATSYLFAPLGMNQTFFHINQGEDFEAKAIGYVEEESKYVRPAYRSHLIGDGGIYTTMQDMIKWDQNFQSNRLGQGRPDLLERMKYRIPLSNGNPNFMALAQIFTNHSFGKESWSHGGGGGGYLSFYIRFEEIPFSVIVLSNSQPHNAFQKANAITKAYFQSENPPPVPTVEADTTTDDWSPLTPNPQIMKRWVGHYYNEELFSFLHINYEVENQRFRVNWLENGDGGYQAALNNDSTLVEVADLNLTYELNQDGKKLIHKNKGIVDRVWIRVESPTTPLVNWVGYYYCEDIQHSLQLSVQDSILVSDTPFATELINFGEGLFRDKVTFSLLKFAGKEKFTLNIPQGDRNLRHLEFRKVKANNLPQH